jgi:hypothetical protein
MVEPFLTIVPDVKRIFLKNFVTSLGVILGLCVLVFIIHVTAGLDVFMVTFEELGVQFSVSRILIPIAILYGFFLIIIFANSLILRNLKYEFYSDKVVLHQIKNIIFVETHDLFYQNVSRVYARQEGISSIFNIGTIVLDLTGTIEEKKELFLVTNPETVVQQIHSVLQQY